MISLAGTTADGLKGVDSHYVRWLVILRADELTDGEVPQYFGTFATTLGAIDYEDLLASISHEGTKLNLKAGVAPVSSFSLSVRNEGRLAATLTDQFSLENDEVELYALVYEDGDSPSASDLIPVARGVIDRAPSDPREWTLDVVDISDRDWDEIPNRLINLQEFNFAPLNERGHPLPVTFGTMNVGPYDGAGTKRYLAQCRCVDGFVEHKYTAGRHNWTDGTPFQRYPQANNLLAEIIDYTDTDEFFTIDSTRRQSRLRPSRPDTSEPNDISTWYITADGDSSTTVSIPNGDTLAVYFSGSGGKLGSLYADPTVEISGASGSYNYSVDLDATNLATGSDSGDASISLAKATWAEDWDFEILKVSITASGGAATVAQVELKLSFDDQTSIDQNRGLDCWRKVAGVYDATAKLVDGSLITGVANTVYANPVDQVHAILRMKDCLAKPVAEVDTDSFDTARALRTSWNFAFTMYDPWTRIEDLDPLLKEAGLHLYLSAEGKWRIIAREKSTTPQHAFIDQWNIAVQDAEADADDWLPDIDVDRTSNRDIINDYVIHAQRDRSSDDFNVLEIASAAFRVNGTCSVSSSNNRLTADSPGQSFTADATAGMATYVDTDQGYTIVSVIDDDNLEVTPIEGGDVTDSSTGTEFWMGPNLSVDALRSFRRYKVSNPLGRKTTAREIGGYQSSFVADSATAILMINYWLEWHARVSGYVTLSTFLMHLDVEPGDVSFLDHPDLPESKRPTDLTVLDGALTAGGGTFSVTAGESELIRDDDDLLIRDDARRPEIVKVTSVDYGLDIVTASRGQYGTTAVAHGDGATVSRVIAKWEVLQVIPATPADTRIRLTLLEMPLSYFPTLVIAPDGTSDWGSMTDAEKARYRAIAFNSNLIEERNAESYAVIGAD